MSKAQSQHKHHVEVKTNEQQAYASMHKQRQTAQAAAPYIVAKQCTALIVSQQSIDSTIASS
eukprot:11292-Heterococcus_DN1.PRE.1